MTPTVSKELKRCLWIFVASFFLSPLVWWTFIVYVRGGDYSFREDYFVIYRDLFSSEMETLVAWLIILAPVIIYEVVVTGRYYYQHPSELRSAFCFSRRHR